MTNSAPKHSWDEMQQLVSRAVANRNEVLQAVAHAPNRAEAAARVSRVLGAPITLTDQLLDLPLADFASEPD